MYASTRSNNGQKKHYCDWYKYTNNQYCYSQITKIRIIGWKTDERFSCEWRNDYTTAGYQIVIDENAGEIEIRNQSNSMALILW